MFCVEEHTGELTRDRTPVHTHCDFCSDIYTTANKQTNKQAFEFSILVKQDKV